MPSCQGPDPRGFGTHPFVLHRSEDWHHAPGYSPVTQALLGTLFTWGLTAAGAALVFLFSSRQVMLAASYWSLLAPAIDMAEDSGEYGLFAFVPVAVGFALGAAFVYLADLKMPAPAGPAGAAASRT